MQAWAVLEEEVVALMVYLRIYKFVPWVVEQVLSQIGRRIPATVLEPTGEVPMGSDMLALIERLDAPSVSEGYRRKVCGRLTDEYDVLWPFCCRRATSWS